MKGLPSVSTDGYYGGLPARRKWIDADCVNLVFIAHTTLQPDTSTSAAFGKYSGLLYLAVPYEVAKIKDLVFQATYTRILTDQVDTEGGVHHYRTDTYYGG